MPLLSFRRLPDPVPAPGWGRLLAHHSIEVMPRTAAKIADFRALLPRGTEVFVAHIDGTPIADMRATVRRLSEEGFAPVPHVPARLVPDARALDAWLAGYADAGARAALVLAGGIAAPRGAFDNAMQLLETGAFDRHGFDRLHVAGHPEGNRDIDPEGGDAAVMDALRWKAAFAERTGARMGLVTQFAFDAGPVLAWADRLRAEGIDLPIRLGIAGPAKLQTLIRFAVACGVGPSLAVLQKRAMDVTRLLLPYTPADLLAALDTASGLRGGLPFERLHVFPLGGIETAATWIASQGGAACAPAAHTG